MKQIIGVLSVVLTVLLMACGCAAKKVAPPPPPAETILGAADNEGPSNSFLSLRFAHL